MACLVILDPGCVKLYVITLKVQCMYAGNFGMYADLVAWMLSNSLVKLCVDDELLCLCLLCKFIFLSKFSTA